MLLKLQLHFEAVEEVSQGELADYFCTEGTCCVDFAAPRLDLDPLEAAGEGMSVGAPKLMVVDLAEVVAPCYESYSSR